MKVLSTAFGRPEANREKPRQKIKKSEIERKLCKNPHFSDLFHRFLKINFRIQAMLEMVLLGCGVPNRDTSLANLKPR